MVKALEVIYIYKYCLQVFKCFLSQPYIAHGE